MDMKLSPQVCKELFVDKLVSKISRLGSGKMGCVYKVELNTGEILCVKTLPKGHHSISADSQSWKLAYEHLGFDFKPYTDNHYFYFTIPYFEGKQFQYAIQYSIQSRLEIIQNLIKAVQDLHKNGIIHRDIKCSNIIISQKAGNKVNIIDFGRSVFFNSSSLDKDLQLFGQKIFLNMKGASQPFTAPEYFTKNSSTIGFYSDYYSIAQLYKFLIPEYSHLATEVLNTKGEVRKMAFENFSKSIDKILKDNQFNQEFNETDKIYSETYILYRKIIFFICEVLKRLINLLQRPKYSNSRFFKEETCLYANNLANYSKCPTLYK